MDQSDKQWDRWEGLDTDALRSWLVGEHMLVLLRTRPEGAKDEDDAWTGPVLYCEHDFESPDLRLPGEAGAAPRDMCPFKAVVAESFMEELREAHGAAWKAMGLAETILDLHRRAKAGEWLGQPDSTGERAVFVADVALVLDTDPELIRAVIRDLYAARRLDLSGMQLTDFERRFRLPHGLSVTAYNFVNDMLENGATGMEGEEAVLRMERRMGKALRMKDGSEAFGAHWPDMDHAVTADVLLRLAAVLRTAIGNTVMRQRVFRSKKIERPRRWLKGFAEKHPGIRTDALEEYGRQFFALVRERYAMYRGIDEAAGRERERGDVEAEILEDAANALREWARWFQEQVPAKKPTPPESLPS